MPRFLPSLPIEVWKVPGISVSRDGGKILCRIHGTPHVGKFAESSGKHHETEVAVHLAESVAAPTINTSTL